MIEHQDLIQIGTIGLIKAADRFDESLGFCFSTYAVPLIMGEIRRYLRDDGTIRISRSIKENVILINRVWDEYIKKNSKEPSMSEIQELTGLAEDEIVVAMGARYPCVSLDDNATRTSDTNREAIIDTVRDDRNEYEKIENHLLLEAGLSTLNDFERRLIRLRFFDELTQNKVAKELGITQVQVCRNEKKILEKLRLNLSF